MLRRDGSALGWGSVSIKCRGRRWKSGAALREAVYSACLAEPLERRVLLSGLTTVASFSTSGIYNVATGLIADSSGNLYGTTSKGGANNHSALFEIVAGSNAATTLASFTQDVPAGPSDPPTTSNLAIDAAGNIYGADQNGGPDGQGSVYELVKGGNTLTTLATFNGANGQHASGGISLDSSGNIFGTAAFGVPNGSGTIWELAKGSNTINVLATFNINGQQGSGPEGPIVLASNDDIYGVTFYDGLNESGTVFELAHGSNTITVLAQFNQNGGDGLDGPYGGLVMDGNGNLYGTVFDNINPGFIYEVAKGSNTVTTLASFNVVNGFGPQSQLYLDAAGNLFGTTVGNGDLSDGTVFELASGSNAVTVLATLPGESLDLPAAAGNIAVDVHGNLYGAANAGGASGVGEVFELPSVATIAPAVSSFAVNGGAAQRSMVTQATLVFNQPVKLGTGALSLARQATGGGSPTPVAFDYSSSDGGTTWNLTFPAGIGGSLADGAYILTVAAADVTGSSSGVAMTGGNQLLAFDRLFGDADGNGTVNNADYFQFKNAYAKSSGSPGYNPIFDYDANGIVNNADYFQFKARYGQSLSPAIEDSAFPAAALVGNSDSRSKISIGGQILAAG
jgi:uncharacterized repeat protein (TIGR03803 family)